MKEWRKGSWEMADIMLTKRTLTRPVQCHTAHELSRVLDLLML